MSCWLHFLIRTPCLFIPHLTCKYQLLSFAVFSLLLRSQPVGHCCCCSIAQSCLADIAAAAAKSIQSCLTLCDPIDGSPPGFPVPGILQARTLEWVAISFSNA